MSGGVNSLWRCGNYAFPSHRLGQRQDTRCAALRERVIVFQDALDLSLLDFPKFDGFVVGGKDEVGGVGSGEPGEFVDFLVDFQTF